MMWSTKHNQYLVGNEESRRRLGEWLRDFLARKGGTKRAALLVGPAGTGKTCAAYQALREHGCQVVEQNASAVRTRKSFEATILQTVNCGSLFGGVNALLIPNVDVMNPALGGLDFLMHVINPLRGLNRAIRAQDRIDASLVWTVPIILTLNEIPRGRLADLENDCETIFFERLSKDRLEELANHVLSQEESPSPVSVTEACEAAQGDARSLMNVLQTGFTASTDRRETTLESACRPVFPQEPVTTRTIFQATEADALGTTSTYFENYLEQRDSGQASEASATSALLFSDADLLEARIFERQEWELLPYIGPVGCASALSRHVEPKPDIPKRMGRRSDRKKGDVLFHGSTRSKSAFISVKQKQLADLRPRLLLEGQKDASPERLAFLGTLLTSLLYSQGTEALASLMQAAGLSASTAEEIVRTVGFRPFRSRDKSALRSSALRSAASSGSEKLS